MATRKSASSQRVVRVELSARDMKRIERKHKKELDALARMKDEHIDFSDIPEKTDWSNAVMGKFYRPVKEPVTLRIDADVLAWLKSKGKGYQTRINSILRNAMLGKRPQRKRAS